MVRLGVPPACNISDETCLTSPKFEIQELQKQEWKWNSNIWSKIDMHIPTTALQGPR